MKWIAKIRNNKYSNTIIRVLIFVTTYYFLYRELFGKDRLMIVLDAFQGSLKMNELWLNLFLIIFLMPINWALETFKWKFLIKKIEKVSFWKATAAVYSGISVSMFTPNRVGEWFGRIFVLEKANHIRAVIITILSGMGQLFTTIVVGTIASVIFLKLYFINVYDYSELSFYGLISIALLILGGSFLIFFNVNTLPTILNRVFKKSFNRINYYVDIVSEYTYHELSIVLGISFLRFLVFSFQFYISLRMFSISIPFFHGMLLVGVFYFIMTAIPTITLAELGIRGIVSIYFFQLYFSTFQPDTQALEVNIVAASYMIWMINLVLPAIIGTFFVLHLKFIRKVKMGSKGNLRKHSTQN